MVLCGEVNGDTFTRTVSTKHFMRVVGGYGISEDAFIELGAKGIKKLIIKVKETGDQWETTPQDWLTHAKVADYGSGKQRFLSLKYMRRHV